MKEARVGVVGCGAISGIYLKNLTGVFKDARIVACADLLPERAEAKAKDYPGVEARSVDALLASTDVDIVLNLTIPIAHGSVAQRAVEAGKSVHNEKPLTITREDGRRLLKTAEKRGVRVGSAPDTFLGAGIQTCRQLIDEGAIGKPVAATAFMLCRGHESWHPDPEFYYKVGGGPMFDMGPYYLTALVSLLGPVSRVTGSARITFPERLITSKPKSGTRITVDVPTHVAGIMDFASGAVGTIVTSFDVWGGRVPRIEIYGAEATLSVPDPNTFGGPVEIKRAGANEWEAIPIARPYEQNSRGIAVADMARALRSGGSHRADGRLAYHVLDIMHAFHDASAAGRHVAIKSTCERPEPLPQGLEPGRLEA